MPTMFKAEDLYFMGDSAAIGANVGDFSFPRLLAERIYRISVGTRYSLIVAREFNESAGEVLIPYSAGFIPDINSYKGHLGLPKDNLKDGSNSVQPVFEDQANMYKSYAGVELVEGSGIIHSMFLDLEGNAWATGANGDGQLCLGNQVDKFVPHKVALSEKVVDIAIGAKHTLLLTKTGKVFACGSNNRGQLGLGEDLSQTNEPVRITELNPVESISAGMEHSLIKTSDALYVFGSNEFGQLCTNETIGGNVYTPRSLPTIDEDLVKTFTAISQSTFVLHKNGTVDACGRNNFGQLGDGTNTDSSYSSNIGADIPEMAHVVLVGKGPSSHSGFFHTDSGYVYATGLNANGQLGLGDFEDRNVPTRSAFSQRDGVLEIGTAVTHTLTLGESGLACPATENNCLPGGCDGVCSGASGIIGDGSCKDGEEACVDLTGIVGTDSVRILMCYLPLSKFILSQLFRPQVPWGTGLLRGRGQYW